MKSIRFIIIILWAICCVGVSAQRHERLRNLTVTARRPMKDIGVQRTTFDSLALKDNIALSMADVLAYNSSLFVKNHGRATLSTVAFRGTSAGHTQVTWNGLKINSPMLGTTDFSTIPSYFIDRASLLHGSSSVNETGGGLGGLVKLATAPDTSRSGWHAAYVQGIGSFGTFDEFGRVSWHRNALTVSTRAVYSSSPNDYTYINHDKKENIYDSDHNIVAQYHPRERNRSGAFKDLHLLQEVYYTPTGAGRWGLNVWYSNSWRELPLLTVDYGGNLGFDNSRRETSLRAVASWDKSLYGGKSNTYKGAVALKGGYALMRTAYDYSRETVAGLWNQMTRSRSEVNTAFGSGEVSLSPWNRWYFNANISAHQHFVRSHDKNVVMQDGNRAIIGYDKARLELSGAVSAKWQPVGPLGISLVLRNDVAGTRRSPIIPAVFADYSHVWHIGSLRVPMTVKASASRNYRFPSLNDLYFLPGGNPSLRNERGYTCDLGVTFDIAQPDIAALSTSVNCFGSRIDDWIIWLPTTKGFFSPRNVQRVHASGVETSTQLTFAPWHGWQLGLNGSYSYTPSVNRGEPASPADKSVGRQLPYVPLHTGALTARLSRWGWTFMYKWNSYSRRYTMSSNDYTLSGHLPAYFMSNIALERKQPLGRTALQFKLAVNNLFNEDYLSILSRPMPGINFELFAGIEF